MSGRRNQHPQTPVQRTEAAAPESPPVELSTAVVQQLIENQTRELALRGEEVKLRGREIDAGHHYAEKALSAQLEDRHGERQARKSARRDRMWFWGLLALVLVGTLVGMLYMGKDAFAQELLKALVFLASGGTGGYFAGRHKAKQEEPTDD